MYLPVKRSLAWGGRITTIIKRCASNMFECELKVLCGHSAIVEHPATASQGADWRTWFPYRRFTLTLGGRRAARGRSGPLYLNRVGLSPTFCRSLAAISQNYDST